MSYRILLVLIIVKRDFFGGELKMGLKPHALNKGDEVLLGWEMDRYATGLLACYGFGRHGFTLAHNALLGKKRALLDGQHELMENQFLKPKLYSQKRRRRRRRRRTHTSL